MIRAAGLTVLGVLLVALGFVLSPWPWVAAVVPGTFLAALGTSVLWRTEVPE